MHLPVFVLFLLIGISCTGEKEKKENKDNKSSTDSSSIILGPDTSRYTIIPFEKQTYLFRNARSSNLSLEEIETIELLLGEAVEQYNMGVSGQYQIKPLEKYKRQFVPIVNQRNEKEVWVNCFCGNWDGWRQQIIGVDGGGSCFFSVKINLSEKKTYDLNVNGPI